MKLQIHGQSLRFRLDEREFAQLLAGATIAGQIALGGGLRLRYSVALSAAEQPVLLTAADHWRLQLPQAAVQAYALRLPCREGLAFTMDAEPGFAPLQLCLEVDVRDSIRQRGAVRRAVPGEGTTPAAD